MNDQRVLGTSALRSRAVLSTVLNIVGTEAEVVGFHLSRSLEFLRGDLHLLQDCGHFIKRRFHMRFCI